MQVRAVVDLLPDINVVADDVFNSSPTDPALMGPEVLRKFRNGESISSVPAKTPLVAAVLSFVLYGSFLILKF